MQCTCYVRLSESRLRLGMTFVKKTQSMERGGGEGNFDGMNQEKSALLLYCRFVLFNTIPIRIVFRF